MNGNGEKTPPLHLGELVPDVTLVDHDGEPWRFSEHRGVPHSWCFTATSLDSRAKST